MDQELFIGGSFPPELRKTANNTQEQFQVASFSWCWDPLGIVECFDEYLVLVWTTVRTVTPSRSPLRIQGMGKASHVPCWGLAFIMGKTIVFALLQWCNITQYLPSPEETDAINPSGFYHLEVEELFENRVEKQSLFTLAEQSSGKWCEHAAGPQLACGLFMVIPQLSVPSLYPGKRLSLSI